MIGERIKRRRTELGISTAELAGRLYLSASAVRQWQHGDTIPRVDVIPALCTALECTPNYLFEFCEAVNG